MSKKTPSQGQGDSKKDKCFLQQPKTIKEKEYPIRNN